MVENQWNLCRFPYRDNAIFKPSKIKLIQDVCHQCHRFVNKIYVTKNIKPDKFSNISNHIVFFFVHYFISVSKSSSCPSGVLFSGILFSPFSSSDNKSDFLFLSIFLFEQSKKYFVRLYLFATISVFVNLQVTEKVLIPVHKIHNILLSP